MADEAVLKDKGDSLERVAITASSLKAEQVSGSGPRHQDTTGDTIAQTGFENVSKTSNDSLLVGVNTPRSDEDSMKLKELMDFCTKLQQIVLDLENTKTAQAREITSLKLRVKKLEKKGGSRTHKLKRLYKVDKSTRMVSSDEASLGVQEDASKQGRKIDDIDKDAEITLVDETQGRYGDDLMFDTGVCDDEEVFAGQDMAKKRSMWLKRKLVLLIQLLLLTLMEIKSAKPNVKGVVIGEQSESTTRTRPQQLPLKDKGKGIMEEPEKPTKRKDQIRHDEEDNVQAMIDADYQMALQLQAEEQEKLSIEEKSKLFVQLLEARKKHFAAMRAQEKRRKPPTKAQKRNIMSTYMKNMAGYKHNQLNNKSFDDIQNAVRAEGSSKRAGEDLQQESTKKQKMDDVKETAELQSLMEVIPDEEEVAVDVIPLATKPPSIVD
ncbi:hypothetical protein Tco_0792996 [Tanacetum coccineum]